MFTLLSTSNIGVKNVVKIGLLEDSGRFRVRQVRQLHCLLFPDMSDKLSQPFETVVISKNTGLHRELEQLGGPT